MRIREVKKTITVLKLYNVKLNLNLKTHNDRFVKAWKGGLKSWQKKENVRKVRVGKVVSDKMEKTIVVAVERGTTHYIISQWL